MMSYSEAMAMAFWCGVYVGFHAGLLAAVITYVMSRKG